ncbi:MAG: anti-sigma factor [Candidatus Eisenbacteria bacterium]
MNAHREAHLELCAAQVLGAIDEADRLDLAAHRAAGCLECEREIVRLEQTARLLAESAPPATPSAALRTRTLAAVAQAAREDGVQERGGVPGITDGAGAAPGAPRSAPDARRIVPMPARRPASVAPWVFAAAAGLLAVATIGLWRQSDQMREQLTATRSQLTESEQKLLEERRWTAVLDALDARAVNLTPTPDGAADLRGRGTWDPVTRRAVIVFDHVTPPAGRDYELWGLHPSGPRSLGIVRPDASGRAIVRLEDAGDSTTLTAFAISLEPAGGSPNPNAPSGPVVMVGQVPS